MPTAKKETTTMKNRRIWQFQSNARINKKAAIMGEKGYEEPRKRKERKGNRTHVSSFHLLS